MDAREPVPTSSAADVRTPARAVTNPATTHTFLIRAVSSFDLWSVGALVNTRAAEESGELTEAARARAVTLERELLVRGVVPTDTLRIVREHKSEERDVGLWELNPADRDFLFMELMIECGLRQRDESTEVPGTPEAFRSGEGAGPDKGVAESVGASD